MAKAAYIFLLLLNADAVSAGGLGAMGRAIAPYLPRVLPTLNLYVDDSHRMGPEGCHQMAESNLSTLINMILEACENNCGNNLYKVIKYAIPTYSRAS